MSLAHLWPLQAPPLFARLIMYLHAHVPRPPLIVPPGTFALGEEIQ